ncbi:MAG: hypothetical protein COV55_00340 [Candidatus Komeilibacteria bacterium CG11_big_fil_rev_8_21_14_0_20_36_20]|uniref:Uncharacterized protein n=1 Tax=Candidatus Komeilibacteria bacterium CG11_big_fil_rev_8_21_14_0_20_36_20 TaxID=1974477 RepID=A0A2H0NEE4_9BACT|nr:MAG: hypothetical protein COV55_00340 [Candidatus Komeilibacteria bacterium CG11_big_fil_rev_8_21_14_0_20_36_20]PIR82103.1 MAG: hypothetical protein COU21_00035 [Candidatus Komeilibacteria bacterium CG10_big_fil_rev_8_21_14_0_10_36_65]PJC55775.1 MAG: hypothetical protein CO027_00235 [Candidatus Komeilibacteria bacterium CG_4_9_14_0_2_um_filter_36_13]
METNQLPKINMDTSETGCCPRFNPQGWDQETFSFDNKLFVKAKTRSFFHLPLNIKPVFIKTMKNIDDAQARLKDSYLILSYDPSAWTGEHYFAVEKDVPGEEMVRLSGHYITKVFEGPFQDARKWVKEMQQYVKNKDRELKKLYFFYTTCPKCLKHYGKNYTVAFAEV